MDSESRAHSRWGFILGILGLVVGVMAGISLALPAPPANLPHAWYTPVWMFLYGNRVALSIELFLACAVLLALAVAMALGWFAVGPLLDARRRRRADARLRPPTEEEIEPYYLVKTLRDAYASGEAFRLTGEYQEEWRNRVEEKLPEEDRATFRAISSMAVAVGYVGHVVNRLDGALPLPGRVVLLKRLLAVADSLKLKIPVSMKEPMNHHGYWDSVLWSQRVLYVLPEEWQEGFESAAWQSPDNPHLGNLHLPAAMEWLRSALPRLEAEARKDVPR